MDIMELNRFGVNMDKLIINGGSEGLGHKTFSNFSVKYDYKNYNNPFFRRNLGNLMLFNTLCVNNQ